MPDLEGGDLEALMRSVFGPNCHVLAWHLVDHGDGRLVVFVTLVFPARIVVLKLADPHSTRLSFAREAAIQQCVARETSAPVCEMLAVDDSCQRFPWRYLMMAHAPGMRWRDGLAHMAPHARYSIFRQLGETTAALHRLRYPLFGEIEEMTAPASPRLGEGSIEALAARARQRIANPAHAELFIAVLQAHASDFVGITEPRLTHEDLNPSNLLLVPGEDESTDWSISALLDFGSAWAGCPESDIARLELWRDMMDDGFREGYTAIQPIAADYPARRPIYQLLWCLEYAHPTTAHHTDTARVCAALDIPPVTYG